MSSFATLTLSPSLRASGELSIPRGALRKAKRVVIKAGTSVVTSSDGLPSLVRIGSITEQVSQLVKMGKEVIIVSSGAGQFIKGSGLVYLGCN